MVSQRRSGNTKMRKWKGIESYQDVRLISMIIFLGSTKDLWLTFGGQSKPAMEGFCNVDWGGQKHRHSISGYSFHMGAGAISWSSKKQHVVVLSSTEAEYIAQMHAAKEVL